ncbi:MAG: CpsB/CapC family capsule biosynthesis tyrosine phosphatase [Solirubrobacteraceae bacterium]|nr:CpsB/CapC family capsule biosynthesis tyrosine phosphatase [Solirubrobacteraceae bacterium]
MIDLHCHLLPGIDDGPADVATALEQARAHVEAGIDTVVCTPHVSHNHANTSAGIAEAVAAFQAALDGAQIPLAVKAGAEVSLSRAIEMDDDELTALHLGGSPYLLLEPPLGSEVPRLAQLVKGLASRGHKILVAHPERCAAFHRDDKLLAELVKDGAIVQLTAGSLAGDFGRTVQKLALSMASQGLVHVVASDAHDPTRRPPGLAAPMATAKLEGLTAWACQDVPAAVLAGQPLPERPAGATPKTKRRLFGR